MVIFTLRLVDKVKNGISLRMVYKIGKHPMQSLDTRYYRTLYLALLFTASTAPSGAPEMFVAEVGQRKVNFSWSPPPVTQHNGLITSYTLSCSPSPSSLRQSPSQSGPLTVAGFSPDTSYSCSVVPNNGLGSGPPAHTNFTTLQDCKLTIGVDTGL